MRWFRRAAVAVTAFVVGFGFASAFGQAQDGRLTPAHHVEGANADITGDSFSPVYNQCIIYGVLVFDATASVQVEVGLVRCASSTLEADGTCRGGHVFAESASSSGFNCNEGPTFDNGEMVVGYISRDTSTKLSGYIRGTGITRTGFIDGDDIRSLAWGEAVRGGGLCPSGPHVGHIDDWRREIDGSFDWVNNSDLFHGDPLHCWTVSAASATGDFDVN